MNREIKFRAWDGERLRRVNTIGWTNGEVDWLDTPKYHGPIDEDIKLMQYTGLKDKNGVEIYELDKIKGKFKGGQHFVMIVGWNEKKARFDLYTDKRGNRYGFSAGTVDMGNIEIIGNLLEDTK